MPEQHQAPSTTSTPQVPAPQEPKQVPGGVPDSLAGSVLDLMWTPADYAPAISGSGAMKLASSAVAPLVAIAHGYKTIVEEDLKELFRLKAIAPTGTHARQIRGAVGGAGDDALLMPWFSASTIGNAAEQRRLFGGEEPDLAEVSLQLRPARPRVNEKTGKAVKYELLAGQQTPLGFHPSTPVEWLREPKIMFITEGALKADSALSAYLISVGVQRSVLAQTFADLDEVERVKAARVALREIMTALPADKRVLVMALVGVGTWHQHPDWSNLRLRDIDVWVAFDADVASNPDVWRQASALWKKVSYERGKAHLLALPGDGADKSGVDDYLATRGDWDKLTTHLTRELPKAPPRKDVAKKGEMRIDPDRLVTVKCEPVDNEFGQKTNTWVDEYRFAGRVKRIKDLRSADPEEMRTGKTHTDVDPALVDSEVEIELSWHEPDGVGVKTVNVLGTAATLADPPEQWHRRGAIVPSAITAHPDWPPKAEWLRAMKSNRAEEIERTTAWEQMGWVPTSTGTPVFIAGRDVLGAEGIVSNPSIASPGIDEARLAGATMFGLTPAETREETRAAVENVVRTYLAAWTNPAYAAVVLAAAIRPVAPMAPRVSVLLTGSAGGGKTWSMSGALHFWQGKPGAFKGRTMGAVSDTFAATEYAISRVPIWGIDDLAPSPDGRKADSDEAKVTDLIRAIHNDSPKRRMNADMTSRGVNSSRVMAMFSAENPLSSISAMQRVIHVRVTNGFLPVDRGPTDALDEMVTSGYQVNHVTAACIQYIQRKAAVLGWENVVREYETIASGMAGEAVRHMEGAGDAKRAARNAADLGLGLRILLDTAQDLRVDEEIEETLIDLIDAMYGVAAEGYRTKKAENAGINAVRAVALALASGGCHITSASGDGALPITAKTMLGHHGSGFLNEQLGWAMPSRPEDTARPKGTRIGTLVYKDEDPVVILYPEVAFSVAQRAFPRLLQHGMKPTTAWETAWAEKLLPDYWRRKQSGGGTETIVVRAKGNTGVPVRLQTLLDVAGGGTGADEPENEGQD